MKRIAPLVALAWSPLAAADDLSLDALLNISVVTATKSESSLQRSPAVITVITRDDIEAQGYLSLAEALRTVPGLYSVYDQVTHNTGIRGVNGGARASGNVLKLMIDGQAVPFRPTTGNFFGEELIPIRAVERVEIIRGPASALYGANAFLGVINVITVKGGEDGTSGELTGTAGVYNDSPDNLLGGAGVSVRHHSENIDAFVSAYGSRADRSGLAVGATSPDAAYADATTTNDLAQPRSGFGRLTLGGADKPLGSLELLASAQLLDSGAELYDIQPMTGMSREVYTNQHYRTRWQKELSSVSLSAFGTWFRSAPGEEERLNLDREDRSMRRDVETTGFEAGAEAIVTAIDGLAITAGADYNVEDHVLQSFEEVYLEDVFDADGAELFSEGEVVSAEGAGQEEQFTNIGAYGQAIWDINPDLSLTVGARVDMHNIYGTYTSPRAAVVWAPPEGKAHAKVLYGTSFKAPSAEQLYTTPISFGGVAGNAELEAQTAQTAELAGGYRLPFGDVSASAFYSRINGRVEYIQQAEYLTASNAYVEDVVGGELDSRLLIGKHVFTRVGASFAQVLSSTPLDETNTTLPVDLASQFPQLQVHVSPDARVPKTPLHIVPTVSWVSSRHPSQSNYLVNYQEDYEIPSYVRVDLAISAPELALLPGRVTAVALRADDLLDAAPDEPGYGGIDFPTQGRRVRLTISQEF